MSEDRIDVAWTGTPVRAHPGARENGSESLPWGGRRDRLPLRWPFADAVEGFRKKALGNPSFDPATVFVWGSMMAVALIEALKAVEARFGAEGHDTVREAIRSVGEKMVAEMMEGASLPEGLTPPEVTSLFASWINEVCYASVENPRVHEDRADFDIHYCPHEDVYGAFDCRVQRYIVQGMIDAARAALGEAMFDARFATTIPSGASTCHFDLFPRETGDAWSEYSDRLRGRALRLAGQDDAGS